MDPSVFGADDESAARAEALGRHISSCVGPASARWGAGREELSATSSALYEDRPRPGVLDEATEDAAGLAGVLDVARSVKETFGAFTFVPDGTWPPDSTGPHGGALAGLPVAVKDNIAVKGMPLTAGSDLLVDEIAVDDAAVVTRLRELGAVIIGKAALDEFAFGTVGPGIVNPAHPGLTTGGSSGGSAVTVAAGACPIAIGTDTGGSVRIPASCTGVVGFKPTSGWMSNEGVIPLSWSLDTIGLFGRGVETVAATYGALAAVEVDTSLITGASLAGLRVAIPDDHYLRVSSPSVLASFRTACRAIDAAVSQTAYVSLPDSDDSLDVQYLVVLAESASYHRQRWGHEAVGYSPSVASALGRGDSISATAYLAGSRARTSMRAQLDRLMLNHDVLVVPTLAVDPPSADADTVTLGDGRVEDTVSGMLRFTALYNHVGYPAITIPLVTDDGLPRGLQLVGRPGADVQLLMIAAAVEELLAGSSES